MCSISRRRYECYLANIDGPWHMTIWLTSFWLYDGAKALSMHSVEIILRILNFDLFPVNTMRQILFCDAGQQKQGVALRPPWNHEDEQPTRLQSLSTYSILLVFIKNSIFIVFNKLHEMFNFLYIRLCVFVQL